MKHVASVLALVLLFSANAAADDVSTLTAPDETTVVIYRDNYGVPHIRAATEAAAFYGQGYATAQDRLFQMEVFRRTALGRLSEVGLGQITTDRQVRATTYTEAERAAQFSRMSPEVQTMIASFVDGINAWLAVVAEDPLSYRPAEFFATSLGFSEADPAPWTVDDVMAVSQLIMRQFGQYGGEELFRAGELAAMGIAWFNENRPINDENAPTTIQGNSLTKSIARAVPSRVGGLDVDSDVVAEIRRKREIMEADLIRIGIPPGLGSFAAIVDPKKSASGNVLLLGAPQLSPPTLGQTNLTVEVEIDTPTLHVAGMTVAGVPGVIIGHTDHHAWTLTSGNSDNTDTFVEILSADRTQYFHDGAFHNFEVIPEPDIGIARMRTVHGPVIGLDAAGGQAFTWQMTFWDREMEMVEAFYRTWKAGNLEEFEASLQNVPMNFNVFYAGRDQRIKYFHVGTLLRNTQTLESHDPRLPRIGDGTQEWGDNPFLSFHELPQADGSDQSYFNNWNNKPVATWNNGDNIPWSVVFREERTLRVQKMEDFIGSLPAISFDHLKEVPLQIDDHGTYQQVVEFTDTVIRNENVIPPGQSGFVSVTTGPDPHTSDQWALHEAWAFKNMVFNEPVLLWPPNNETSWIVAGNHVDSGDPSEAIVETIWVDEETNGLPAVDLNDCRTVGLRADRNGDGNGRVYTLHVTAPDPVDKIGTAALFQVYVPLSESPVHAYAADDGPAVTVSGDCSDQVALSDRDSGRARLNQNRPNPFNPSTRIEYELPTRGQVVLAVYNLLGQEVQRLVHGVQDAGTHSVVFDGIGLSSGVYFYTLQTRDGMWTRKMILQK